MLVKNRFVRVRSSPYFEPTGRWQAFKLKYAPWWFIRKWPVKFRRRSTVEETLKAYFDYETSLDLKVKNLYDLKSRNPRQKSL